MSRKSDKKVGNKLKCYVEKYLYLSLLGTVRKPSADLANKNIGAEEDDDDDEESEDDYEPGN